jgi:type II secretory pathway pseudopilin PulG
MSLVEALVTMALLAVVLLALAPLFSQSVNTNASSSQLSVANTLAREKLEELMLYPTTDPRLSVLEGEPTDVTDPQKTTTKKPDDLPKFWNPKTGATSSSDTSPGAGWFPYPWERTYTVVPYTAAVPPNPPTVVQSTLGTEGPTYNLAAAVAPYYQFKLITVTVRPRSGPFPGLRSTVQSAFVRYRNALPN